MQGFDFTDHMRRLCADMVGRMEELGHINLSLVAMRFCQTRKAVSWGMQASLTPLRFRDGELMAMRRGRQWTIERIRSPDGVEMLYLLSFYLPRFQQLPFEEKLVTVFHELWHISPDFNGDIRRLPGRCHVHSARQCQYDAAMKRLVEKWMSLSPPEALYDFLRLDFRQLGAKHGGVFGTRIPTPRLVPVDSPARLRYA